MIKSAEERKAKPFASKYEDSDEVISNERYSRDAELDEYLLDDHRNLDIIEEETTNHDEVVSSVSQLYRKDLQANEVKR